MAIHEKLASIRLWIQMVPSTTYEVYSRAFHLINPQGRQLKVLFNYSESSREAKYYCGVWSAILWR